MIIREAQLKDAAAIAQVHVDAWQTTYRGILPSNYLRKLSYQRREQHWKKMLSLSTDADINYFIYVAENPAQEIIGFVDGGLDRSIKSIYQGEIYALYILEAYQRQGIGSSLVELMAAKLSQSGLNSLLIWVLADNSAVKFYQSLGGKPVAQRQIKVGRSKFAEIAYGWNNTQILINH